METRGRSPRYLNLFLNIAGLGFGEFTVVQWDESGNLLAHVQGNVTGTRVTMETGFQSVE